MAFTGIDTSEVKIPRYDITVRPWESWGAPRSSPSWWRAYNNVKHGRDDNFPDASLQNVLSALCGLLILQLYLQRRIDFLQPIPTLFDHGFPESLHRRGTRVLAGVAV